MNRRLHPGLLLLAIVCLSGTRVSGADKPARPNIVVIISDDAGYADFGFQGSRSIATPHLDSIARRGIRFTNGYVTASVCSPSRAGLMTGRYQQRFGHEFNVPPVYSEKNGLPLSEVTLQQTLRKLGYRTIGLGKWHLGYAPHFHPLSRGFDDYFGFLQGARSYFPLKRPTRLNRLLRDRDVVPEKFTYLTDRLGRQAAEYIKENRGRRFFMYLSFNAVHTPMHARPDVLAKVPLQVGKAKRRKLIAMTVSLDHAVGEVLQALKANDLDKNTLLFFVNDNGGARTNASSNQPLRGRKGSPFEGGIRIPFLVQWPDVLPTGKTYDKPVSTLDIFATSIAVAGHAGPTKNPLDGVDLVPYLTGRRSGRPHQVLYWRKGPNMAIRDGDWKLLRDRGQEAMLFQLADDPVEANDLAARHPDRVRKLLASFETWNSEMVAPRWKGGSRKKKQKQKKKNSRRSADRQVLP